MSLQSKVLALKNQGLTYQEVADALGITRKRAEYWGNARERYRRQQESRRAQARRREREAAEKTEAREEKRRAAAEAAALRRAEADRAKVEQKLRSKIRARWRMTKKGADAGELEFTLTEEDVDRLLHSGVCTKTGIAFEAAGDFAVSIDRVDNSRGYTTDNVQAVCWIYNRAKGANTDMAVLRMAEALVERTRVFNEWD